MSESTEQPLLTPVVTAPAASAPSEHHVSFWRSLVAILGEAAQNPAVLALIPAPERGVVQVAGAVAQLVADPNASPASLTQS